MEGAAGRRLRESAASRTRSCTGRPAILLDDPRDLAAYGAALTGLLRTRRGPSGWARGRANASASSSPARAACSTTWP